MMDSKNVTVGHMVQAVQKTAQTAVKRNVYFKHLSVLQQTTDNSTAVQPRRGTGLFRAQSRQQLATL